MYQRNFSFPDTDLHHLLIPTTSGVLHKEVRTVLCFTQLETLRVAGTIWTRKCLLWHCLVWLRSFPVWADLWRSWLGTFRGLSEEIDFLIRKLFGKIQASLYSCTPTQSTQGWDPGSFVDCAVEEPLTSWTNGHWPRQFFDGNWRAGSE